MRFEVEEVATPNEGSPASILVAQLASPSCLFSDLAAHRLF